jgi:hypothetical protein
VKTTRLPAPRTARRATRRVATVGASAPAAVARPDRRRRIDPTTCERDYGADEVEFMQALDRYKQSSGRMFPTCSEILEVVRSLGYAKQGDPGRLAPPA